MSNTYLYILQIGVLLAVALLMGQLSNKLVNSTVLGELIGGILLGPTVLKTVSPDLFSAVFPSDTVLLPDTANFIQIGMFLFMYVAGLEINFRIIWKRRRLIFLTSSLGIIIPLCLGIVLALFIPMEQGHSAHMERWIFVVFIGTALSISALPIIIKTLMDLNILKTELGTAIVGSATIDDLIGWTIFSCLISFVNSKNAATIVIFISVLKIFIFIIVMFLIAPRICKTVITFFNKFFKNESAFIGISIVFILFTAFAAEMAGIHPFFAVFILGTVLSKYYRMSGANNRVIMHKFAIEFFAPLYFVSIGLKANFMSNLNLPLTVAVLLIACIGKIAGAFAGAVLGGMNTKAAVCVGVCMNSRGAVEIIIASTALDLNMITEQVFVALVIMAIVTSLISTPVVKRILKLNSMSLQKIKRGETIS